MYDIMLKYMHKKLRKGKLKMKGLLTKILALVLVALSLFTLTACGDTHKHAFEKKDVSSDYLASEATCTAPAKYYYSCECGEKGSATFEVGSAKHDYIDHVCSRCQDKEVYTEGLAINAKNGYVIGFKEGATIPTDKVIIPTKIDNIEVKAIGAYAFANSTFKQIQLPEGIELIGMSAFENSKLTSITIPSTVMQIQVKAFANSSLATANFLVTEGWYRGRHVMSSPGPESLESAATMAKPESVASALRSIEREDHGGNQIWYRLAK